LKKFSFIVLLVSQAEYDLGFDSQLGLQAPIIAI